MGRVRTLIITPDSDDLLEESIEAANAASHEHPSRVIVVATGDADADRARLDAQIRVGGDAGAGEVVVLRLSGPLAGHADSVVMPFLLPDIPVVAWWPDVAPAVPAQDPLGKLAIRRITDATNGDRPAGGDQEPAARIHRRRHRPGLEPDHLLAGAARPRRSTRSRTSRSSRRWFPACKTEPALDVLAGWLASRIDGPVRRAVGELKVELERKTETITLSRPQEGSDGHPEPDGQAGRPGSVGAQGNPRMPGRGYAPAGRRRDLLTPRWRASSKVQYV